MSAGNVADALEAAGHDLVRVCIPRDGDWNPCELRNLGVDVVFPVLHGPMGEDGTIQGLLEVLDLAYVGCGVTASAVAMDKVICKEVCAAEGIPVVEGRLNDPGDLELPLFVKPANMGSSVGVSRAGTPEELAAATALARRFDRRILFERALDRPRELEVSVLGNDEIAVSAVGEINPGAEFYTYEDKYKDGLAGLHIPARISEEQAVHVQDLAERAFRAIDGAGLARIDFLMAGQAIYLNEINTMPGFTEISMYPKLWEHSGLPVAELVDRLVSLALERHAERRRLKAATPG